MKQFLVNNPIRCLSVLALGILTTLAFDLTVDPYFDGTGTTEWVLYAFLFLVASPFRLFTYAALFLSYRLLAEHLAGRPGRVRTIAVVWSLLGVSLATLMWGQLALTDSFHFDPAIKRFKPEIMADAVPGWAGTGLFSGLTLAEVALGKDLAARYTWSVAIAAEFLGIVINGIAVALLLGHAARRGSFRRAWFAPVVSVLTLGVYSLIVPWSVVLDFDIFIGDALLGAALINALEIPGTLIFGGFTLPAVWVSLTAAVNVVLIALWTRESGTKC